MKNGHLGRRTDKVISYIYSYHGMLTRPQLPVTANSRCVLSENETDARSYLLLQSRMKMLNVHRYNRMRLKVKNSYCGFNFKFLLYHD